MLAALGSRPDELEETLDDELVGAQRADPPPEPFP